MQNRILIAGMHMADNQFSRFVHSYGFHVVHQPDADLNKDVPITAGAVICTSQISHGLRNKVSDVYKSKGVPYFETRTDSAVAIKEQFEKQIIQPIKDKISLLDKKGQVIVILMLFNKIGSKINSTAFKELIPKYVVISESYLTPLFTDLSNMGVIQKIEGKGSQGMWRVLGLTRKQRDQLITKLGESLPDSWLIEEVVEQPVVVATPVEPTPEVKPPMISSDFEKEIKETLQSMKQMIGSKMAGMQSQVDRLSQSFSPNDRVRLLQQINDSLNTLSIDELQRISSVIYLLTKK